MYIDDKISLSYLAVVFLNLSTKVGDCAGAALGQKYLHNASAARPLVQNWFESL